MDPGDIKTVIESNTRRFDVSGRFQVLLSRSFGKDDGEVQFLDKTLAISANDVISGKRIGTPMRARQCQHIQCFDGDVFIAARLEQMCINCELCAYPICDAREDHHHMDYIEGKDSSADSDDDSDDDDEEEEEENAAQSFCPLCNFVRCPICKEKANMDDLYIDFLFHKWLKQVPVGTKSFHIEATGKIKLDVSPRGTKRVYETIVIDD